jgi:hypothetical protein
VVEKTPENLLHADLIRGVLPEARFLHVVRDPRAVFASMRMATRQWAYPGDLPTSPVAFARNYWNAYVTAGERLAGDAGGYLEVRYEDLLDDASRRLAAVFEWLDLPAEAALCARAVEAGSIDRLRAELSAPPGFFRRGEAESWRGELSAGQVRVIEHLCAERMRRFGYHCSGRRPERVPVRLRLADGLAGIGRKLVRGPLGRPLLGLFGRARRSAETVRGLLSGS